MAGTLRKGVDSEWVHSPPRHSPQEGRVWGPRRGWIGELAPLPYGRCMGPSQGSGLAVRDTGWRGGGRKSGEALTEPSTAEAFVPLVVSRRHGAVRQAPASELWCPKLVQINLFPVIPLRT